MDKWADYLISEVKFNNRDTHIVSVKVCEDNGDKVGSPVVKSRQWVVDRIDEKFTFETIFKSPTNGKWERGAKVHIVTVEGVRYIKTRADSTKADNLDDLPRF